ncbi:MAG: class I adenylate-forming enzyme family protein [Thermodesulfobacteriota bacterium]|nr:class I adenylate-forming enzyme family protein [Thermodesulfobacteriota bacterium]
MVITEILARNSRRYKNETALIERSPKENLRKEITWNDFYQDSSRLANALVKNGIKKGDKVVQLMTNCLEWLPIYFGILNTGALAVPLNFRFESDKIRLCTEVSCATVFIFGEEFIERISEIKSILEKTITTWIFAGPQESCPDYAVTYQEFMLSHKDDAPPEIEIKIEDDAALYFTSGTTGTPKAVLLTHRNLEHACYVENRHHNQTHDDTFLCIPPLYHTGAKMHWFGSFVVGGKGVILKGVKPEWIFEAVSEEKATIVWLLVPWAHDILMAIENGKLDLSQYRLDQWRLMHIGAQPVPPSLIEEWKEYFPNHDYDTNYGLTETTGPGCVHLGIENHHKVGAIGVPGFDWECRIIDGKGNILPKGETGELIVKGPGVMKEYYKNPEATKETLKNGWLHTGDIARYGMSGFIWLVDRKKDVIICGGENIFPVEIEHFFMQNKKIQDIAVLGIPDDRLGEIPAGIISIKPGKKLTKMDIMNFGKELPRYKRLRKIIFGDVPRNPTGKIEKPKLRRLYSQDKRKNIKNLIR